MAQLDSLYFESESSTFWSNVFFPTVQEVRREKIFKPKAKKLAQMLKDKGLNVKSICDVGAGHGFFLEELRKELPECEYYAVEPDANSASVCTNKGITTLQATAETAHEWAQKFDLVISSEVLEHVHDVKGFIDSLFALLKKDGHCLITCLGYEGFDILTLQEKSASVTPPHHLNFLSIEGFESVFKRSNFVSTDIWTPGQLDVDIVLNSGVDNEFLRVLKSRGPEAIKEFQQFLVKHKMSSHIWALAKK
jgi:SAM-dependent methyltransferase